MNIIAYVILAGVAAFIFFQLRNVLGKTPYDPKQRRRERMSSLETPDMPAENDAPTEKRKTAETIVVPAKHNFIEGDQEKTREIIEALNHIKKHYPAFATEKFITGAKKAYTAVIEAFTENRLSDIRAFTEESVIKNFQDVRDEWRDKGYSYENSVILIESVKIKDVAVKDSYAEITASFIAETVGALRDAEGEVIQGDPKKVTRTSDIWTFRRPHSETGAMWVLVKTGEA